MEQTKNPSILSTRIEILKFKLNNAHEIPPEHHFNLITPGGCSDKTFARYISCHSLIDEAVLLMLEQTSPRFQIWRKRNNLPERIEKAFVKKNGALPLLKYPVQLSAESSETLLKPEFADELLPYMTNGVKLSGECSKLLNYDVSLLTLLLKPEFADELLSYMTNGAKLSGECSKSLNYDVGLLTFSPKGEAMLLELKNSKLAAAYLQHNHLYKGNENLLLLYDDANVYEAFCRCNSFSSDLAEAAIKEKSPDVLRIVVRQYGWFSGEDEILALKRNDLQILMTLLECRGFSLTDAAVKYLALNCPDAMFTAWLNKTEDVPFGVDAVYERLFKAENRAYLKAFIRKYAVPGKYEIRLIESDDKELLDLYFSNDIEPEPETIAWLLEHESLPLAQKLLKPLKSLGFCGEAKLFQIGNAKKIADYLRKLPDQLCPFSEATLFRFAPADIICDYMRQYVPDEPAQIAMLRRCNMAVIKAFAECGYMFDGNSLRMALNTLPEDFILDYFKRLKERSGLELFDDIKEDTIRGLEILYRRGFTRAAAFLVRHGRLSSKDVLALMRFGSLTTIRDYLISHRLDPEAKDETEVAFILRGDKKMIETYIADNPLGTAAEIALLSLGDAELVLWYNERHGFDNDALKALGL